MNLEAHPAANLFPPMSDAEYAGLVEDIRVNGQREPIKLSHDGLIVDGRNRYRACLDLGKWPITKTLDEDVEIVPLVLSLNLHRRSLDESQRALVAARAKEMFESAAKQRQGQRTDISANLHECSTPSSESTSNAKAAEMLNVSPRSVATASQVLAKGIPDVVALVEQGHMAVSAAAVVAQQPAESQQAVAEMAPEERKAAVKRLKQVMREAVRGDKPRAPKAPTPKVEAIPNRDPLFRKLTERESEVVFFWDNFTEEMTKRPHSPAMVADVLNLSEFRCIRNLLPAALEAMSRIVEECMKYDVTAAKRA